MLKLSKRQSMTLFFGALLSFPIIVQAAAPPLMVCAGVFFIEEEEEEVAQTPSATETPIIEEQRF